jgi:hypothetical protein
MSASRAILSGWLVLVLLPVPLWAAVDEGRARFVPWSGYWWPVKKAQMIGPLRKYDALTGLQAAGWEARHKSPSRAEAWFGYCHAWSAASLLEREPRQPIRAFGMAGRSLPLGIGDQKGLLTICHYSDPSNVFGKRYEGKSGDDFQDIYPDVLWKQLRFHLKQRGVPLVLDIDPGPSVWNYPVFHYRVSHRPLGSGGRMLGRMELLMADDAVAPNHVGTKLKRQVYQFTFQVRQGALMIGSGRWHGASRKWHPDFAWYPTGVKPENPHIRYAMVKRLLRAERTRGMEELEGATSPELARLDAGESVAVSSTELVALVAGRASSFKVELSLGPGTAKEPAAGKPYSLRVRSAKEGHLYLFHLAPGGKLRLLYPMPEQDNRLTAGKETVIGGAGSRGKMTFVMPKVAGTHQIKALVTRKPLSLGRLEELDEDAEKKLGQGRAFHWAPTEAELVEELLRGLQEKKLTPADIEEQTGCSPASLLGPHGQKELAFRLK